MTAKTPDFLELCNQAEMQLVGNSEFCSNCDKSGSDCEAACSRDKLLHKLRVHQIELEMQNENLRQAYAALEESHQRYNDLYEFAPVGYLILSSQGVIEKINLTGATLLGKESEQLLNLLFARLVALEDRDRWQLFFWNLMRFDLRKTIDLTLKRDGNTPFYAQMEGIRVTNRKGGDQVWLALSDMTERKQFEDLKLRCERYQLAENASAGAIWDWDILTDRIHFSERWYRILGYWQNYTPARDSSFASWEALLHPEDREKTLKCLRLHLEDHSPFLVEYRIRKRDGDYRWLFVTGQAVWDKQGQPIRMTGTVFDITERKQAEQVLVEAREISDAANRFKSEFLANMSHEIRTPMAAIMGMTHLVQHTELTANQRNYLNKVDGAAHSLLRIIDNILDFSKIEAGKLDLEQVTFSLAEVLHHVTDIVDLAAKEKNIELVFFISEQIPPLLIGDSLRLSQVLINLLSNAIKFSTDSKVIISITQEAWTASTINLQFSVQDSGIGISSEQMQSLFRPFCQGDTSSTRQYGGTGLGLTISKQLVEMMGGSIWVESAIGKGSCFFFTLTLGISAMTLIEQITDEVECELVNLAGRRVLVAEDNDIASEVAIALLSELGIQVEIAMNGRQAAELAATGLFDAVLMDIQMPEMDGLTATRLIRADKALQDLPIIAMTAHALSSDKEKSLAAGMNDHLTKPLNPKKLAETLSRWLSTKSQPLAAAQKQQLQPDTLSENLLPPELRPFDIATALARMKNNTALLRKLILMFRDDYIHALADFDQMITEGNYEAAERLVHSIKGAATILEVEEIPSIAAMLERAIQKRELAKINLLLKVLAEVLTPAINAAASLDSEKSL